VFIGRVILLKKLIYHECIFRHCLIFFKAYRAVEDQIIGASNALQDVIAIVFGTVSHVGYILCVQINFVCLKLIKTKLSISSVEHEY
jgi:hypothetical protein